MKKLLFISIAAIAFASCKKYEKCDNGELCIKNIGNDTIHYAFGSSSLNQRLNPGATICNNVGPINADPNNSQTSTVTFNSDHGNYFITVDECHVDKEID